MSARRARRLSGRSAATSAGWWRWCSPRRSRSVCSPRSRCVGCPGSACAGSLLAGVASALACAVAVALLLPPRGRISEPEYYAHGPEIPRALEALEAAAASVGNLQGELEDQLLGIARLVALPADREATGGQPRLVVASDLHNNVLGIPLLEDAAGNSPVLFAGDLTDRGSPLETRLVQRIAGVGKRFVFVSGNHDSDVLQQRLARAGAIVLSERGRLLPSGRLGRPRGHARRHPHRRLRRSVAAPAA